MSGCSNMKLYGSITLQNDDEMTNTIPPVDLLHDEWMLQHEAIRKYYTAEWRNDEHHPTCRPIAWWVDAPTWSYMEVLHCRTTKWRTPSHPVDLLHHEWMLQHEAIRKYYTAERRRNDEHHPTRRPIAWWVDAPTWSHTEVLHCRMTKWRTPSHP